MTTLLADLERIARARGSAPAWHEGGVETSYADLVGDVGRVRDALARAGVRAAEVVAVRGATARDVVVQALGVRAAGAIPRTSLPGSDAPPAPALELVGEGRDLRVDRRGAAGAGHAPPEGVAWLRVTSGSSGVARTIAFTESQALAAARRAADLLGDAPGPAVVTTISPASGYGWSSGALAALLRGLVVVAVPPTSPRGFLEAIDRAQARAAVTTPAVVRGLARAPGVGTRRDVHVVVAGDAYPAEAAVEAGRRHGLVVVDRYGSTETGVVAQARAASAPLELAPGVEVSLEGDPPTLRVRSDAVAWGEFRAEEGWRAFGGAFATADAVEFEGPRAFRVRARVDRVVKRAGRVVDLGHLERRVLEHPGVALARVLVRRDGLDVRFDAQVVARAGASIDAPRLLDDLARRLPEWERLARVEVVEAAAAAGKWSGDATDAGGGA